MDVGFTGTRDGMTHPQRRTLWLLLQLAPIESFRHGDCIGADEQAHRMVDELLPDVVTVAHPPSQDKWRANCEANVILPRLPYLQRDEQIVRRSDVVIACPKGPEETRSGTWYTVRRALGRRVPVVIVWPDGSCEERVLTG